MGEMNRKPVIMVESKRTFEYRIMFLRHWKQVFRTLEFEYFKNGRSISFVSSPLKPIVDLFLLVRVIATLDLEREMAERVNLSPPAAIASLSLMSSGPIN